MPGSESRPPIKTAIGTAAACDSAKTAISCAAENRSHKGSTKQNTRKLLDDGNCDSRVREVLCGWSKRTRCELGTQWVISIYVLNKHRGINSISLFLPEPHHLIDLWNVCLVRWPPALIGLESLAHFLSCCLMKLTHWTLDVWSVCHDIQKGLQKCFPWKQSSRWWSNSSHVETPLPVSVEASGVPPAFSLLHPQPLRPWTRAPQLSLCNHPI